jgi:hypothetical protein
VAQRRAQPYLALVAIQHQSRLTVPTNTVINYYMHSVGLPSRAGGSIASVPTHSSPLQLQL